MQQDSALVRFETQIVDQERPVAVRQYWVAVVRFRYSQQPMATEDLYFNPLGFQVFSYRRSPETLPAEVSAEPPQAPAQVQLSPPTSIVRQPAAGQ